MSGSLIWASTDISQTYLHIFTSPKSAVKLESGAEQSEQTENIAPSEPQRKKRKVSQVGKKSVAAKVSMRRVTPRSIAYAAVHVRSSLSRDESVSDPCLSLFE